MNYPRKKRETKESDWNLEKQIESHNSWCKVCEQIPPRLEKDLIGFEKLGNKFPQHKSEIGCDIFYLCVLHPSPFPKGFTSHILFFSFQEKKEICHYFLLCFERIFSQTTILNRWYK